MHWIDPHGLPETRGTVTRFLLNPQGELDGFVLGLRHPRQVHFPPHLSRQIARCVASYLAPGAHVQAWGHGIRNRHGRTIEVDEIAERVDAAAA
ncbi:hypothetical protein [Paraburkholderia heleia]|uniref:hypothetical protein n=1 Tax=Paraburkholderia heleia TaxID=634127 RepID=UPI002AB76DA0|nr:hypothetical protein [Paraburkholderia heleia]